MHYDACCDSGRVNDAISHCDGIGLTERCEWRLVKGGLTNLLGRCGVGWRAGLSRTWSRVH